MPQGSSAAPIVVSARAMRYQTTMRVMNGAFLHSALTCGFYIRISIFFSDFIVSQSSLRYMLATLQFHKSEISNQREITNKILAATSPINLSSENEGRCN